MLGACSCVGGLLSRVGIVWWRFGGGVRLRLRRVIVGFFFFVLVSTEAVVGGESVVGARNDAVL